MDTTLPLPAGSPHMRLLHPGPMREAGTSSRRGLTTCQPSACLNPGVPACTVAERTAAEEGQEQAARLVTGSAVLQVES